MLSRCRGGLGNRGSRFHHVVPLRSTSTAYLRIGARTYYTHPAAQTLFQKDHISFTIAIVVLVLSIGISIAELCLRLSRGRSAAGFFAIASGCVVGIYSLFGLLFGVLALGPVAILLVCSGLPIRKVGAVSNPDR